MEISWGRSECDEVHEREKEDLERKKLREQHERENELEETVQKGRQNKP